MPAQRRDERVSLGLRRVETAHETGKVLAAAVELETVFFERVHDGARQLQENFVDLDRRQRSRGGYFAQPSGDARCRPVRGARQLEPETVLDIRDQLRRGEAHLRPDLTSAPQLDGETVGEVGRKGDDRVAQ